MTILGDASLTFSCHGGGWSLVWRRRLLVVWCPPGSPWQGSTTSYTPIDIAYPRPHTTHKSQLGSIKLPKYAHWVVLSLAHLVRHSTFPYSRWSGTVVLSSDHPCLTDVHKNGLGPSQTPPTTVSSLQLWSHGVVQVTYNEKDKSSSRLVVYVSYPVNRVCSHVSSFRTL